MGDQLDRRAEYRSHYEQQTSGVVLSAWGSAADRQAFWDTYLDEVLPTRLEQDSAFDPPRFVKPIADVTQLIPKTRKGAGNFVNIEVRGFGLRLLVANPNASDETLRHFFEAWLAEVRKDHPAPVKRRGRPSSEATFAITDQHLASWANYYVLAVIDLAFWAELSGCAAPTHEDLYGALWMGTEVNAKEWGRAARVKANEAIASLDALLAEVQSEPN